MKFRCSLLLFFCLVAGSAQAFMHGRHYPGKYVFNVSDIFTNNYPFINFLKSADVYNSTSYAFPAILNADGYPQSTPASALVLGFYPPPSYAGSWYIAWSGQFGTGGVAGVSVTSTIAGGSGSGQNWTQQAGASFITSTTGGVSLTGTDGAVEVTPPATTARVNIAFLTTGTISNVTNVAMCRTDQVASAAACLAAGAALNPEYVTALRGLNVRVLRFLGWNHVNSSNRSRQTYDTPTTHIAYAIPQFPPAVWGGTISSGSYNSGTDTYTGSAPSGWPGLVDGATVQYFMVSANNSSAPKLIVGTDGPIQIANMGANAAGSSPTVGSGFIAANKLMTFVYDATTNLFLATQTIGNAPGGLTASVPLSVQAALCNAVRTDCWFQIPTLYNNAAGIDFAAAIQASLNTSNKAFIEYSNEIGTSGPAFQQYFWANANAAALGFPEAYQDWYALRMRQLFGAITPTWTSASPLNRVAGAEIFMPIPHVVRFRFGGGDMMLDSNGFYTSGTTNTTITAKIESDAGGSAGTHLKVTATSGRISVGMGVTCGTCTGGTIITDWDTGTGGIGNYNVNNSQLVSSQTITLTPAGTGNAIATDYTTAPNRPIDYTDVGTIADYFNGAVLAGNFAVLQTSKVISSISQANPGVVTVTGASAAWANGDRVHFSSIGSMTQLSSAWTTVANLGVNGTDTFTLSNTANDSGVTISSDTSAYTAYTSGATASRNTPCLIGGAGCSYGLVDAADDYFGGTGTGITNALNWMDNDVQNGTQLNSAGTPVSGQSTVHYLLTDTTAGFKPWTDQVYGASAFNKPQWLYEGGYQRIPMTAKQAGQLGIDQFYVAKTWNLFTGYMNDSRFANGVLNLSNGFMTFSNAKGPGWLVGPASGVIFSGTASISGNVMTTTTGTTWYPGAPIWGPGIQAGTAIISQLTGTSNGAGTYLLNTSQTVGSQSVVSMANSEWGMYPGDLYSTPFQSYNAVSTFDNSP